MHLFIYLSVDSIVKREHWYTRQVWIQEYRRETGTQGKCGYKNTEGTLAHRTSADTRIQWEHWGTQDKCGYKNTEGKLVHRASVDTRILYRGNTLMHRTSVDTRIQREHWYMGQDWIQEYRGTLAHRTSVDTGVKMEHWYTGQVWIQGLRWNTGTRGREWIQG
jgi:hypothetical protein